MIPASLPIRLATATPTPTPTPSGSSTSTTDAVAGAFHAINTARTASTCAGGDVSICGLVEKVSGSSTAGQWTAFFTGVPLRILLLIALAIVCRKLLHVLISRLALRISEGPKGGLETLQEKLGRGGNGAAAASVRRAQRAQTLGSVLKSAATAAVFILFGVMILDELGFPIAPLITSAGVLGVAIGFGAQSLVKDVLSGVFLLVEDQYGVGDVVDVGSASGTIEAVGLRVTRMRDVDGTVWYVRNGEILKVGNHSQGWSRVVMDVDLEPTTDLAEAEQQLLGIASGLREDPDLEGLIIGEPDIWGITEISAEAVTLRLVIRTRATRQTAVAAALREQLRRRLTGLISTSDGTVQPATAPD